MKELKQPDSKPSYERELAIAREAALAAGAVLRRHWTEGAYSVRDKTPNHPVTDADLEANCAIERVLKGAFPGDGWLSEETADNAERLACERVWIVDPLDGTKEFIERVAEFSVAIALAERGEPVVGVTYNPITDELFWGARRTGVYLGQTLVRVSRTHAISDAKLLASRSETKRGEWRTFDGAFNVIPTGSVAYKLALVAAGIADATFTLLPKSEWDVASGAALISEAGGLITDLEGRALAFNRRQVRISGIIASNGLLHDECKELALQRLRSK